MNQLKIIEDICGTVNVNCIVFRIILKQMSQLDSFEILHCLTKPN